MLKVQQPKISLDMLVESFGVEALNEALPDSQRSHAARLAVLARHVLIIAARQVALLQMQTAGSAAQDKRMAELIETLSPVLTGLVPKTGAQEPAQAAGGEEEAGGTSEDDEAAAMAERVQRESAEEVAAVEAMARGEKGAGTELQVPVPALPAVQRKAPVKKNVPPAPTNGSAS